MNCLIRREIREVGLSVYLCKLSLHEFLLNASLEILLVISRDLEIL